MWYVHGVDQGTRQTRNILELLWYILRVSIRLQASAAQQVTPTFRATTQGREVAALRCGGVER